MLIFRPDADPDPDDEIVIRVESDEHEMLEFEGGSTEEAEAKLDDFLTWAR